MLRTGAALRYSGVGPRNARSKLQTGEMSEPRRPILRLKTPPKPASTLSHWRCKPCGANVEIASDLAADTVVRCPACNARLGLAGQFLSDPPQLQRVRARPVGA